VIAITIDIATEVNAEIRTVVVGMTNNTEVYYLVALTLLLICPVIVKGVILMVHIGNALYV